MTTEKDFELDQIGIHLLIKTGKREHLEQFADGLLYCNSLAFLSDPKHANETWFDADEGLAAQFLPEKVGPLRVEFGKDRQRLEIQPAELAGPIKVTTGRDSRVFCTYAVHPGIWSGDWPSNRLWDYLNYMWIKPRIHAYGQHAAIITNVDQFVARVRSAVESQGFGGSAGLVKYVDLKTHHGAFPQHLRGRVKHIKFMDEREHRFVLIPRGGLDIMEPIQLKVGALRDLVQVTTWDEIRRTMNLSFPHDHRHFPVVKPKRLPRKYKKGIKKS